MPALRLAAVLTSAGGTIDQWTAHRRETAASYADPGAAVIAELARQYPELVRGTTTAADRVLRHEFDLLGSGPFTPADPGRPARRGYMPIDWCLDPVSRLRFPAGVPYKDWDLYKMRPGNADIKLPWELARCQHFAPLGQAFRFTGDGRYPAEILDEIADFTEANPVGVGIHWTCTMDVAIRAANWAIGLDLIRESAADASAMAAAYEALFDHGAFIRANLENTYEVTSNHFLSDVVGLLFVAAVFSELDPGREWWAFAREAVEREMSVQVLPDGADFESSVPYHRLVAELFLAADALATRRHDPFSSVYRGTLRKMIAFLAGVLRPDGLMPQVGDADDGRLHVFTEYGSWRPQDARHLFGPAARMFDEPAWAARGGEIGAWESAWWCDSFTPPPAQFVEPCAKLYPDAGLAIMRRDSGDYLLVTNGRVGTRGFGNHKHNDQLAFEFHSGGTPLLVDPGSFVYTSDPDARNLFRSTGYHNTLGVDDEEQNEVRPEWLFRMFEKAEAEHVSFADTPHGFDYCGLHVGYGRLPEPVSHSRAFRFVKSAGALLIVDQLRGAGEHRLRWHFHWAPGVSVSRTGATSMRIESDRANGRAWTFLVPDGVDASIVPAWYSPSYGVRVPCIGLDLTLRCRVNERAVWSFVLHAESAPFDPAADLDQLRAALSPPR